MFVYQSYNYFGTVVDFSKIQIDSSMKKRIFIIAIVLMTAGMVHFVSAGIPEGTTPKDSPAKNTSLITIQKESPQKPVLKNEGDEKRNKDQKLTPVKTEPKQITVAQDTIKPAVKYQPPKEKSSGDYLAVSREIVRRILAYLF
jgi:hypothetical protein